MTPIPTPAAPAATSAKSEEDAAQGRTLVARVVWTKGTFNASMPGDAVKRELKRDSKIYMNDTLSTGPDSQAQIVFTDESNMTFRPSTEMYINQYNYNPKTKPAEKKTTGKYVMDLVTGGFRTITGWVAKNNPDDYSVNTPVATIGVRGTEFSIVYEKGQGVSLKREAGKPCVKNNGQNSTTKCLDDKNKYAQVANANTSPVVTIQQPAVFQTDVEVVPVSFSGAAPGTGGSSGGGGGGFCIQ